MGTWCHLSLHLRHLLYLGGGGRGGEDQGLNFLLPQSCGPGRRQKTPRTQPGLRLLLRTSRPHLSGCGCGEAAGHDSEVGTVWEGEGEAHSTGRVAVPGGRQGA